MSRFAGNKIHDAMTAGKLPVLISLARHDIDLARAAVDAGVFGLKMHLNAYHRATRTTFGSFEQELPFIENLAKLGKPLLVMTGQTTQPTPQELDRLADFGFEGFNCYLPDAQPHLFQSRLRPIPALSSESTDADIAAVAKIPDAMVEASVTRFSEYGKPLDHGDLARYAEIVARTGLPTIAPSQRRFVPDDAVRLRAAGIRAILLGVIVTGTTSASLAEAVPLIVRAAAAAAG
ncbi:hypothetical protein BH10PSE9_BH10PSE9_07920 [soil metagenome]